VDEIATNTTQQTNQPQDQQYHQNCPQHVEISFLYRPNLKEPLDPTTESNLEMSNVYAMRDLSSFARKRAKTQASCITTIRFSIPALSYVLNQSNRACTDRDKLFIIHNVSRSHPRPSIRVKQA
jgi:hypothetical protein